MHKSVRQSMACLHSWLGLSFGWLLFAIFLTGAVTYYRHEISLWMQPEFATMQVNQETALKSAYSYLQQHAPDAQNWYIGVANQDSPVNKVYWRFQPHKGEIFSIIFIFSSMVCPTPLVG